MLKSAQSGNVEDFSSLVWNIVDDKQRNGGEMTSRFPPGVKDDTFDLFVKYIRKPSSCISEDLLQLKLAAESLTGLQALWEHRAAFWLPPDSRSNRGMKFGILWTDMFRWMCALVNALFNGSIDEDTSIVAIASTFILFRDLDLPHSHPIFAGPDVFRLAFRLWLSDKGAEAGCMSLRSEPLNILCANLDFTEDDTLALFLNAALEAFEDLGTTAGRNGEIAHIAIERLDAILLNASGTNKLRAVMSTINTLWIIAKEDDMYGNKKELSSHPKGLPAIVRALNVIPKASFTWIRHMDVIYRGLDLIQIQVVVNEDDAVDRLAVVLRSGLLTTMQIICRDSVDLRDEEVQTMFSILNKVSVTLSDPRVAAAAVDDARTLLDIDLPIEGFAEVLHKIKSYVLKEPSTPSANSVSD